MRQAGRYLKTYRDLAAKYPSFRDRSENSELIVEITLQPYKSFNPDAVILFSDILTPLPAFGIDFDIQENKGPILSKTIRDYDGLKTMHNIDIDKLQFVGEALTQLRREVCPETAVLGFIGSPWTLATYIIEGRPSATYNTIKRMILNNPEVLKGVLSHLTSGLSDYAKFQIKSGAHAIQIFDSWGGQLPPLLWNEWSQPYISEIIKSVKQDFPKIPITLYVNGSGGLLERMEETGVDVIGLDWSVDMIDARRRLSKKTSIQGNIDPVILFSTKDSITNAIHDTLIKAGPKGHILNLGHGVMVGTPEECVAHFFETNRKMSYNKLFPTQ